MQCKINHFFKAYLLLLKMYYSIIILGFVESYLWHTGSFLWRGGLSFPAACGILPNQGSNPHPLNWKVDS